MQETEVGDGTNFLIILVGELLKNAESLITMGLHCSDIVSGYEKGTKKALEILDSLAVKTIENTSDIDTISEVLRSAMASKMYGYEEFLSELVADACVATVAGDRSFDIDNVRVLKIMGGGVTDSTVIRGMVL
jgi:T-complex protein 1 subunit theta